MVHLERFNWQFILVGFLMLALLTIYGLAFFWSIIPISWYPKLSMLHVCIECTLLLDRKLKPAF